MKKDFMTKKWLLYIIVNQMIQFIYLGYALFWFDHLTLLLFYVLSITLINLFCFVIEIYNIENQNSIHRVIGVCICITWYFVFEINNIDNLLILPLTQLMVWWIFIDYIFQGYKDRKVEIIKIVLYISFGGLVYSWLVNYKVFLILYQMMIVFLLLFPMLVSVLKKSMLNTYGLRIKQRINVLVVLSGILLIEVLAGANSSLFYTWNIDYDLYIVTLTLFLIYIVVKNLKVDFGSLKTLVYESAIVLRIMCLILTILVEIIIVKKYIESAIVISVFAFILSLQIHIISNIEHKYLFWDQKEILGYAMVKSEIDYSIREMKKVQEKERNFANFLHDELLQDILYLKNKLDDSNLNYTKQEVILIVKRIISTIRNTMDSYSPLIINTVSLKENYKNLIESVKTRYQDKNIIVDFYCDKEFFLEKPYDILVYRIIKELLNNAFKHTNTELVEVRLSLEKKTNIVIHVVNDGCVETTEKSIGWGTNSLKQDIQNIGGKIVMTESQGMFSIMVEIPILKGVI